MSGGPAVSLGLMHGDARHLSALPSGSIHLVVTSPPYPMIPQWDVLFARLGAVDYAGMHAILADAWRECRRLLVAGGILAINIGDALRVGPNGFQLWPNHADTLAAVSRLGFSPLPYILWKKPTNKPNAFLGSGFLPPNAYVTLDCEFILLFRNGPLRAFPPHDLARRESRLRRADRDRWFSQVWTDIRGTPQRSRRGRSGAFPSEVPSRLVRMFSVAGDTVLDPFAGTGTTLWAALALRRNAIGVEWDDDAFEELTASARSRGLAPPGPPGRPTSARGGRSPPRPPDAGTGAPTR